MTAVTLARTAPNIIGGFNQGDAVELEWLDSTAAHGWTPEESAVAPSLDCRLVGIFVDQSEDTVTVALGKGADPRHAEWFCPITIPRQNVKAIHLLCREEAA